MGLMNIVVEKLPPWFLSSLAGLAVVSGLLATSSTLPLAWDEGNAINRAAGIHQWFSLARSDLRDALSDAQVSRHWRYTVTSEGHPSLYGIIIACGQWLAGKHSLSPLTAARLGPMILFGIAAAAMCYRLFRTYSPTAAAGALAALMTMPRVFAHAHFASLDGPLMSCWIVSWALFASATTNRSRRWLFVVLWGAALGATLSCKFTGWLALLPWVAFAIVHADWRMIPTFAVGGTAAFATFWLVNPRLWYHPVEGVFGFFSLNLSRSGTNFDVPTTFFGHRYDMQAPLPWYNALVWTAITVPTPVLLLGAVGIVDACRRWAADGHRTLILTNWLVLIAARALPGTPVHDGERLILPSFAFFAVLAGIGSHSVVNWIGRRWTTFPLRQYWARLVIVLSYAGAMSSVVWYTPQWLSYYNILIGGLLGADRAGMEATYYWDALDAPVLRWLHANTRQDQKIRFAAASQENLSLMSQWGVLRREWELKKPGEYRWYVLQRRPTFWDACDRWLVEHETPAFVKTVRSPRSGIGPWRLDVPLIMIFSADQYRLARASLEADATRTSEDSF
jgi:4-amino-4-deoxy-L-arabinose transferase-like glycosyltransferase